MSQGSSRDSRPCVSVPTVSPWARSLSSSGVRRASCAASLPSHCRSDHRRISAAKDTKKYFSVRDDAAEDALPGRGRVQGADHLAHGLAPQQRAVPGRELRVV